MVLYTNNYVRFASFLSEKLGKSWKLLIQRFVFFKKNIFEPGHRNKLELKLQIVTNNDSKVKTVLHNKNQYPHIVLYTTTYVRFASFLSEKIR